MDYNKEILKANTIDDIKEIYPRARLIDLSKITHLFIKLSTNLFAKAYYLDIDGNSIESLDTVNANNITEDFKISYVYTVKNNQPIYL